MSNERKIIIAWYIIVVLGVVGIIWAKVKECKLNNNNNANPTQKTKEKEKLSKSASSSRPKRLKCTGIRTTALYDFYFSQKQKDVFDDALRRFAIIKGKGNVEYTEARTSGKDLKSNWDDFKFLGTGNQVYQCVEF